MEPKCELIQLLSQVSELAVTAHSDCTNGRHTRGVWSHTVDSAASRQSLQTNITGCVLIGAREA